MWVSEIMLQQTQVSTVLPYYQRFVARFPTVRSLAESSLDQVLGLWAGLGYYSRARNLHAAARQVVRQFHGQLPSSPEELRTLPGIGRYTAGAVASIAFGWRGPALDGNAVRVLSRVFADSGALWERAAELLPPRRPGDFNEALMELGALVCTPCSPNCAACPVARMCGARILGRENELPLRMPRARPRLKRAVCAIVKRGRAHYLVVLRPPRGLLGGMWDWPTWDLPPAANPEQVALDGLQQDLGIQAEPRGHLCQIDHQFTHLKLSLELHGFVRRGGTVRPGPYHQARFLAVDAIDRLALSRLARKVAEAIHR